MPQFLTSEEIEFLFKCGTEVVLELSNGDIRQGKVVQSGSQYYIRTSPKSWYPINEYCRFRGNAVRKPNINKKGYLKSNVPERKPMKIVIRKGSDGRKEDTVEHQNKVGQ